jgi:hypothetical protein
MLVLVLVLVVVLEGAGARAGECPSMQEVDAIVNCQAKVLMTKVFGL